MLPRGFRDKSAAVLKKMRRRARRGMGVGGEVEGGLVEQVWCAELFECSASNTVLLYI